MRGLLILGAALILASGGCRYFDFQYEPTGFSSTAHKYEVEERIRQWHAREEQQKRLAALHKKLADAAEDNQDGPRTVIVQKEMTRAAAVR